jgi:2-polyprenyl-3-methyl-5-hydroxy-6-metoxy-1,4-benzoquinol methylase
MANPGNTEKLKEKISRRFNVRAKRYDNPLTAYIGERELRIIRQFVPVGADVLDYGCGTGRTALDHLHRGCKLTAYDISSKMLAIAEAKARHMGYSAEFTSDQNQLLGRQWSLVTCIGVMDYYPDPFPLLNSLCNYLQESGRLIVTFPNALSPLGWLYMAASRVTIPATARTPRFIRSLANQAELQVVALRYAFPPIAPLGHTLVVALQKQ